MQLLITFFLIFVQCDVNGSKKLKTSNVATAPAQSTVRHTLFLACSVKHLQTAELTAKFAGNFFLIYLFMC